MPPEQLEAMGHHRPGQPLRSDNGTDLFALGVILYELLTGRHPFGPVPLKLKSAGVREFLLEQQMRGPKSLLCRNLDIDPAVDALILRCLSSDPTRRPATARELAAALRRLPTWHWRARRWTTARAKTLTAATVLACSTGVAGAGYVANLPTHAQKAEKLYKDGEYAKAVDEFTQAMTAGEKQPDLHYARGRAFLNLGNYEAAVVDLLKANPDGDGRTAASLAYCCTLASSNGDAAKHYAAAQKAGFSNPAFLNNLAFFHTCTDRSLEAEAEATRALEQSPGLVPAHYNRAMARLRLWYSTRLADYAIGGLEDIDQVIASGIKNPNSHFFAAALCAAVLADRHSRPADAESDLDYQKGLKYLQSAVELGYPKADLECAGSRLHFMSEWAKRIPPDLKIQKMQNHMDYGLRLINPVID